MLRSYDQPVCPWEVASVSKYSFFALFKNAFSWSLFCSRRATLRSSGVLFCRCRKLRNLTGHFLWQNIVVNKVISAKLFWVFISEAQVYDKRFHICPYCTHWLYSIWETGCDESLLSDCFELVRCIFMAGFRLLLLFLQCHFRCDTLNKTFPQN